MFAFKAAFKRFARLFVPILFDFGPDQETGWHIHEYDYVITAITDCFMLLQHPDGTETESEVVAGNA